MLRQAGGLVLTSSRPCTPGGVDKVNSATPTSCEVKQLPDTLRQLLSEPSTPNSATTSRSAAFLGGLDEDTEKASEASVSRRSSKERRGAEKQVAASESASTDAATNEGMTQSDLDTLSMSAQGDSTSSRSTAGESPSADKTEVTVGRRRASFIKDRRLTIEPTRTRLSTNLIGDGSPTRSQTKEHPAQALQTPGQVLSVWGRKAEEKDVYVPFFAQKPINFDGDIDQLAHRFGVMCHRGTKNHSPNQDDFFIIARAESMMMGVLDGHGSEGHDVAHFAQERLPTYLVEQLRADKEWNEACRNAFNDLSAQLQKELPKAALLSGSTASVVMLDRQEATASQSAETPGPMQLRCAFVGDSSVVHGKRKCKAESWTCTTITDIHRPDRPDELDRIKNAGGKVVESDSGSFRLETPEWSLAMSRSIGDLHAETFGLSHEPEMPAPITLEDGYEHFVLACSDGVWDVIPPLQAVNFIGKFSPEEAQLAAERLVAKAQRRWQEQSDVVDDITAVVLWC